MFLEPDSQDNVVKNEGTDRSTGGRRVEYVDTDLVRRTKAGDLSAYEELFNRYQKRVYNIVYQIVSDENEAADLTQEVFVRVWTSIRTLKAEEAFFTWIRTVAVNICRDYMRRKAPVRMESLDQRLELDSESEVERQVADWSSNPEKTMQSRDLERAVRKAVQSLPVEHREVVVLHHLEGMDVQEIAAALKCPVGTIKSRLARARESLRRKLAGYLDID